ncbi:MAG: hypothetical protein JXR16_07150 [Bermanella sp.]
MGRVGRKKKTKALKQALKDIEAEYFTLSVFDDVERTNNSPMKNSESYFNFYNNSSLPAMESVRGLMEVCILNYPRNEVIELISRLRSGDDIHFKSASFELFLHEILFRQGYELTPHPELSNGSSYKPDFLVKNRNGEEFYLEAVLATEKNELDKGGELRKGVVLDSLSAKPHKNFMVAIDDEGSPKSPPSGKKLLKIIHSWLDTLDPDEIITEIQSYGLDSISPLKWEHDGWCLQIRPIPLKPERRSKSDNLVGIGSIGGGWVNSWTPIRKAIKLKGGRYGELDKPLIVAVNLDSFHLDRIDEMQALYGEEQIIFQRGSNPKSRMERAPNGAWYGEKGPQYKRVSAAWLFNDLHASTLAVRKSTVYINPWANYQIPESLKIFPHATLNENKMNWVDGLSLRDSLELPEGWPEHV